MMVDAQTQKELEIVQARDRGPSLFTTMDRTTTRLGRRLLHQLFLKPLSGSPELRARQAAIGFLHDLDYAFPVTEDWIDPVAAYLDSRYTTLSGRWPPRRLAEATWIALRHGRLLRDASRGIAAVRRLLARASLAIEPLDGDEVPSEIARVRDEIEAVLARVESHGLTRATHYVSVLEGDSRIRGHLRSDLRMLLDLLARLDAWSAMAGLLSEGYVLTEIADPDAGSCLEGEGLRHPFLSRAVPNPVSLRGGETLVFLTGPNMAGKTTYLRTLGVCVYLSQCGLPVPARRFRCSPVDRLVTGLSPEDSLHEGISFFLAEVRRVKEVLEAVARGERTVSIFDEVFRGTNMSDALEASRAVLLGCSRARSSNFIFASHLVELARELEEQDSVKFCYFDGDLEENGLRFDYRLQSGVSNQRFGMILLRREGLPDLLGSIPTEPQ